jgi:hypothetical protein
MRLSGEHQSLLERCGAFDGGVLRHLLYAAGPVALLLWSFDQLHLRVVRPVVETGWTEPWVVAVLALASVTCAMALLSVVTWTGISIFLGLSSLLRSRGGALAASALVVIAASPVIYVLARQPFVGNRYRDTPIAVIGPWIVLILLALGAVSALYFGYRLVSWLLVPTTSSRAVWITLSVVVLLAGLVLVVDTVWYPGWYPLVHSVLSLSVALLLHTVLTLAARRHHTLSSGMRQVTIAVATLVLIAAVPVSALRADGTTLWRISFGSLFASRVVTPLLGAVHRVSFDDLQHVPPVDLRHLVRVSPVTTEPAALGSTALLLTVDSLRADVLGIYGSARGLTPHIDGFFRDAHVFERAYSQYAATRHAVRAMVESRFPLSPVVDPDRTDDLINRLRDNGFDVVGVLPDDMRTFVHVERYNFTSVRFYEDEHTVVPIVRDLTRDLPSERTVVWVHLYQPHDPYEPPAEFRRGGSARERYDGEVRWADSQFQQVVSALPRAPDLVLFGADHGEEFWEHGGVLHGRTVYEETIRVPLLLHVRGMAGARSHVPVANVDIAPTLLSALGVPIPESYEGYDLLGRSSSPAPDRVIYAGSVTNATAAVSGYWKWIHHGDLGLWELYDLQSDPAELKNLAGTDPAMMETGRGLLWAYEFEARTLPSLRAAGVGAYLEWLRQYENGAIRPEAVGRWAGFQVGRYFGDIPEVRQLLERARSRESEPVVESVLGSILSDVPSEPGTGRSGTRHALFRSLPEESASSYAQTESALADPLASARMEAAERLASRPAFRADAQSLLVETTDGPVRRGLARGLARQAADVPPGVFHRLVRDVDVDIRLAALAGIAAQEAPDECSVLWELFSLDRSPSVRKAILERLLVTDRELALKGLSAELERSVLSDAVRAGLIAEHNVVEHSPHLVALFASTRSIAFRNDLIRLVAGSGFPEATSRQLLAAMREHAYQPALRARLNRHLKQTRLETSKDQDDEAGVARER